MTPAYNQYAAFKKQYADCIIFFQLGDFYETFDDDARTIAEVCDIVLTSRDFGKTGRRPLAGVPVRSADGHIARLIGAGHKVVVVDQVEHSGGPGTTLKNAQAAAARNGLGEKPKSTSGIFERIVRRVITPGTVLDPSMLNAKANNYLLAIVEEGKKAGLAWADISTGELACCEIPADRLGAEIERLAPAEVLRAKGEGRRAKGEGDVWAGGRVGDPSSPPQGSLTGVPSGTLSLAGEPPPASSALTLTLSPAGEREPGASRNSPMGDHVVPAIPLSTPSRSGDRSYDEDQPEHDYPFNPLPKSADSSDPGDQPVEGDQPVAPTEPSPFNVQPSTAIQPSAFSLQPSVTERDPWQFDLTQARETILRHFRVATIEPFGCADLPLATRAAGALLSYLQETQQGSIGLFSRLVTTTLDRTMLLDTPTRRNLELSQSGRTGSAGRSLLAVLDLTRSALGGRLLRKWLFAPLLDLEPLLARQCAVAAFYDDTMRRAEVMALLGKLADIERLLQRISSGHAGPREVVALRRSLEIVPAIQAAITGDATLGRLADRLDPCGELAEQINRAIHGDPPPTLADGGVIRTGYSAELDDLVSAGRDGRAYIASLERRERERTGIASLKVGFNKVFGYYLEVSHANLSKVPVDYIRKQTLVGAERYITPEMKEVEAKVLNSQEKIVELETALFKALCRTIAAEADRIRSTAAALAEIDVYSSLAEVAMRRGYCRPTLDESGSLTILNGRHPVVEAYLDGEGFVPNDIELANDEAQILILTGPNMAGKSIFIRQVALVVLLAQIGSFVPAEAARIGLVDRIFTRVGAQDDPAAGQSTFMVEMAETANILHHATSRSLVVLDEIGRGTSTYDGLAIARAIVEYLHDHPRLGAKTLFATHYHELSALEATLPRTRNFRMEVLEEGDRVVFLHRVVPGGADRSYGVYVARLAGIPRSVVKRAEEILRELETKASQPDRPAKRAKASPQLPLIPVGSNLVEEIAMIDVDALTPLEAITKLYELRSRAGMAFRLVK